MSIIVAQKSELFITIPPLFENYYNCIWQTACG